MCWWQGQRNERRRECGAVGESVSDAWELIECIEQQGGKGEWWPPEKGGGCQPWPSQSCCFSLPLFPGCPPCSKQPAKVHARLQILEVHRKERRERDE